MNTIYEDKELAVKLKEAIEASKQPKTIVAKPVETEKPIAL